MQVKLTHPQRSVRMPVMNVRIVRMLVRDHFMPVWMHMGFAAIPYKIMRMLMVLVMTVRMLVLHCFMRVLMLVSLGQMQPDTQGHQCARPPKMRTG